jgi:hypothetical protein
METAVSNIRKHFNNKLILFSEKLFLTMKRAFTKYSTFSSAYFHISLIIRVSFLILGLSFEAVIFFYPCEESFDLGASTPLHHRSSATADNYYVSPIFFPSSNSIKNGI